jgi:hypothetical protein
VTGDQAVKVTRARMPASAAESGRACVLDTKWLGFWGQEPSGVACGEPSDATASLGCAHEHADVIRVCSACAADIQQASGELTCKRCWDGPGRHACYMLVTIKWYSGDRVIVQGKKVAW